MSTTGTDKNFGDKNVGSEYLIFTLGSEEYGIEILKVQEIRGYDRVTHIANTPDFSTLLSSKYLLGLGTLDERMIILVDIEKLLNSEEMDIVQRLADEEPQHEFER